MKLTFVEVEYALQQDAGLANLHHDVAKETHTVWYGKKLWRSIFELAKQVPHLRDQVIRNIVMQPRPWPGFWAAHMAPPYPGQDIPGKHNSLRLSQSMSWLSGVISVAHDRPIWCAHKWFAIQSASEFQVPY